MYLQKSITYLKNNKVKYIKLFNTIICLPKTSPQYNNLLHKQTKEISFTIPFIKNSALHRAYFSGNNRSQEIILWYMSEVPINGSADFSEIMDELV